MGMGMGMGASVNNATRHVQYLDALRGIAAVIVMLYHMRVTHVEANGFFASFPGNILISGYSSVCLFFILSGFVLSYRLIGEKASGNVIVMAMVKRPFRLAGVVIFASFLGLMLSRNGQWGNAVSQLPTSLFSFGCQVDGPLWSIETELYGSFLVFSFLLATRNQNYRTRLWLEILLMIFFRSSFMLAFMFGLTMADWMKHHTRGKYDIVVSCLIIIPGLWLFGHETYQNVFPIELMIKTTLMLGAMLVFAAVCLNPIFHGMLLIFPLPFLGRISFSLYAVHWIFLQKIDWVSACLLRNGWSNDSALIAANLSIVAVCIVIAWLMTQWVDCPSTKLASLIARKICLPQAATTSSLIPSAGCRDTNS